MKKFFIAVILYTVTGFSGRAQISYETTYQTDYFLYPVIKYFNHTSPKWLLVGYHNIYLYNLNHSLYRQIPLYADSGIVQYFSDDLFDTDTSNFEYAFTKGLSFKIVREDTTVLFSRDSGSLGYYTKIVDVDLQQNIFATDSGTKMRLYISNMAHRRVEIYSLPGTLACPMDCGGIPVYTIATPQGMASSRSKNTPEPYPNPSSDYTNIPIELPKEVSEGEIVLYDLTGNEIKRYKVDKTFHYLVLSTADLAAGSYYYQVQTAKGNSSGKKLIVIK